MYEGTFYAFYSNRCSCHNTINNTQGDQKVSVQLMITIQEVTSNVQTVPRQSPDIY
jgi:hypothetical protein